MIETLSAQHVVVAGLGKTGQACVRFLQGRAKQVTCWDTRENVIVPDDIQAQVIKGDIDNQIWNNTDLVVVSPGLSLEHPSLLAAKAANVPVIGEIELFAQFNQIPTLGITGSNGKTTVTLLTNHILNTCGLKSIAAGNVGEVAIEQLSQDADWIVLELSSFQLETTSSLSLTAATVLNVTDDHLDRHHTMDAYREIKHRIFEHAACAVVNVDDGNTFPENLQEQVTYSVTHQFADFGWEATSQSITYLGAPVLAMADCQLVGLHNVMNIQAALGLVMAAGVDVKTACKAVCSFQPAPHRCVQVAMKQGVRYIDDSKATNVGATIAAISGLADTVQGKLIMIVGGDAKGADVSVLKPYFEQHVSYVVGLGKDGQAICALADKADYVNTMQSAVNKAAAYAQAGDVVLLSPACASIDMFANYAERAAIFTQAVEALS